MREKTVVVMPGTLAMPPAGVLRLLAADHPVVLDLMAEIDRAGAEFDVPPVSGYLTDTAAVLAPVTPEAHYLALMAVSLAVFESFVAEGGEPYAIFGQSIGEIWALVAAGGMDIADGARLACIRSRALSRQNWQGVMMAVGAGGVAVGHLVAVVDHPDLVVACLNSPRQTVVCGPQQKVAQFGRLAEELGWATSLLPVPHPSHSPALAPVGAEMIAAAPPWPPRHLRWRLWSPTLRRWVTHEDDPVQMTITEMTRPVHLRDVVTSLYAAGAETFLECSAQEILAKLIHASVPGAKVMTPLAKPGIAAFASPHTTSSTSRPVPAPVPAQGPAAVRGQSPVQVLAPAAAPASVPAPRTTAPASVPPPAEPEAKVTVSGGLSRKEVLTELQRIYGDFLGYPAELLGEDDQLEMDLGVESLKQVTLLVQVGKRFGLERLQQDVRLLEYPTLGRIADMVTAESEGRADDA